MDERPPQTVELGDATIKKLGTAFRKILREELERVAPSGDVDVQTFGPMAYLDLVRAVDEAMAGFLPADDDDEPEGPVPA